MSFAPYDDPQLDRYEAGYRRGLEPGMSIYETHRLGDDPHWWDGYCAGRRAQMDLHFATIPDECKADVHRRPAYEPAPSGDPLADLQEAAYDTARGHGGMLLDAPTIIAYGWLLVAAATVACLVLTWFGAW